MQPDLKWMEENMKWKLTAPEIPARRYKSFFGLVERLPEILETRGGATIREVDGWTDFTVRVGSTGGLSFLGNYVHRQKVAIEDALDNYREGGAHGDAA